MRRLIIYDTSNFIDFPIGGQVTSIGNFLKFICGQHPERISQILLVGVTKDKEETGKMKTMILHGQKFSFYPAAAAESDLGDTAKSLRLQYVKGLLKARKLLAITKKDCNYIHTPEAYGIVKLFCPAAKCVIFSHGSYFNMEKGFRFFQNNLLVKKGFILYLKWILKSADRIFLLDQDSRKDYAPYNEELIQVSNSVVCPEIKERRHVLQQDRVKEILFVGRLSKDKRVEPIIKAMTSDRHLTVVGDGEEYHNLIGYESEQVHFTGSVTPQEVSVYMQNADILVMNSAFEGIPMTILEALSYGLPVVSTPVGGIGEVLHFGQDSEETDGTAAGIRAAIERIAANYDIYSANAYENSKAFDYRMVNQKVYRFLSDFWGT